jgi:hypothetical protein
LKGLIFCPAGISKADSTRSTLATKITIRMRLDEMRRATVPGTWKETSSRSTEIEVIVHT